MTDKHSTTSHRYDISRDERWHTISALGRTCNDTTKHVIDILIALSDFADKKRVCAYNLAQEERIAISKRYAYPATNLWRNLIDQEDEHWHKNNLNLYVDFSRFIEKTAKEHKVKITLLDNEWHEALQSASEEQITFINRDFKNKKDKLVKRCENDWKLSIDQMKSRFELGNNDMQFNLNNVMDKHNALAQNAAEMKLSRAR